MFAVVAILPWVPPLHIGRSPPCAERLTDVAAAAAAAPLSQYPGSTVTEQLPLGWFVNRRSSCLGHGAEAFVRACDALDRLDCLEQTWLTAERDGAHLAICSRQLFGLWLVNVNRVLRRHSASRVSSIIWGTTTQHVLAGEERLSVRWDESTNSVEFEVLSFSRPRHLLAWLGYPYVLCQQIRFGRDAILSMKKAVSVRTE